MFTIPQAKLAKKDGSNFYRDEIHLHDQKDILFYGFVKRPFYFDEEDEDAFFALNTFLMLKYSIH